MLEEWSRTKKAPRHAAWLHELEFTGDSAGGGLTLATLLALKEAGDPLPAAAAVISPWTDMEGLGESIVSKAAEDPMVQKDGLLKLHQRGSRLLWELRVWRCVRLSEP